MVRYGLFDGTPQALETEMRDLDDKIPKGTSVKLFLSLKGRPATFDGFISQIKEFQVTLEASTVSAKMQVAKSKFGIDVDYSNGEPRYSGLSNEQRSALPPAR